MKRIFRKFSSIICSLVFCAFLASCSAGNANCASGEMEISMKRDGSATTHIGFSKDKYESLDVNSFEEMTEKIDNKIENINTDWTVTRISQKSLKEYDDRYVGNFKLSRLQNFELVGDFNYSTTDIFLSNANTSSLLKKWSKGGFGKFESFNSKIYSPKAEDVKILPYSLENQSEVKVDDFVNEFVNNSKAKIFTFLSYDFDIAEKIIVHFPGKISYISNQNIRVLDDGKSVEITPTHFDVESKEVVDGVSVATDIVDANNIVGYVVYTPEMHWFWWMTIALAIGGIATLIFCFIKFHWFKKLKTSRKFEYIKANKSLYLMMIPGLVLLGIFCYGPMIGLYTAFTKYSAADGIFGSEFVGLQNFKNMFDPRWKFGLTLRNTFCIALLKFVIGYPASIILAILFSYLASKRFKKVVQTASYLPHFISWVMISGIAYSFLTSNNGILNRLFVSWGWDEVSFYSEPKYWWGIILFTSVWKGMGYGSITFLAGLTSINTELYEAAKLDGASRWKQIKFVTIPGLMPVISFTLILNMGNLIKDDYEQIIALIGQNNAYLKDTCSVIGTSIYNSLGNTSQFSAATALGLFQSVISLILVVVSNKILIKRGHQGIW